MEQKDSGNKKAFSYNKTVKQGWGNWPNFLASYGLKPTPDGFEEGKQILKAMLETDKLLDKNNGKK